MDFTFEEEQLALRDAVAELAKRHQPESTGGEVATGPQPLDKAAWTAIAETGLIALPFAEDLGGADASAVEVSVAAVELGRGRIQSPYADALAAATLLARLGTDEQHEQLLAPLLGGDTLVVTAIAEPGCAWSLTPYDVTARQEGDAWLLDGVKEPVRYAPDASHAIVAAKVGEQTGLFVVETGGEERVALDGTPGAPLGEPGAATDEALRAAANLAILTVESEAFGAMQGALDLTVGYLKTRKQFGVPLATFQALTFRAADMYVALELVRSSVLYTAMALAADPLDDLAASRLKVVAGRNARLVGQEAIQLHGGIGMTAEYAVGHYTSAITDIEHSWGDTTYHLARLAGQVREYPEVSVLR
ncbi:acyl-CoA dehydrogenase family protein [Branchiibius sp. NY16-3462-2]|uniref:acyl-CoA dehydrogenase family protein n=1 Tax=Branchiibius sp. NY16-3462-2 TaxID=1807500 RepID=UPI000797748D|nr:acyl-CoA dehydrogenase family protein [Branchiibius sp. NY16-3462-2]KYH46124.1 hypothetical protein AZH51_10815 [Branchiibius sp. NY16-3462-2]